MDSFFTWNQRKLEKLTWWLQKPWIFGPNFPEMYDPFETFHSKFSVDIEDYSKIHQFPCAKFDLWMDKLPPGGLLLDPVPLRWRWIVSFSCKKKIGFIFVKPDDDLWSFFFKRIEREAIILSPSPNNHCVVGHFFRTKKVQKIFCNTIRLWKCEKIFFT